jgi:DNA polymerase I-like protein with 3'-5' exonuclease and polymerase domains
MRATVAHARQHGWVETAFGYRLYVPENMVYAAIDYVVQGTAGDICKNAMLNMVGLEDIDLIMCIHDELVFQAKDPPWKECPLTVKRLLGQMKGDMEKAGSDLGIETPVEVSVVRSKWSKPKEVRV